MAKEAIVYLYKYIYRSLIAAPIPPAVDMAAPIQADADPPMQAAQRYIADINGLISTRSNHFQIVVHVMSIWKMLDNTKQKDVKSLELALIDDHGGKIQATIPVRFMKDFVDRFTKGCTRRISNFDHALNINGDYCCAKHEYKIVFEPNTLVEYVFDFDIPNHVFEFTPFAGITSFMANFDYCCVIVGYSDPITKEEKKRITVELEDER
ncbi:OLC1v1011934C1 [Oldenlandia corymbosa var. corymbosa]|uniref:OLC1v1011934C1 n=1 Tax=Oldenlandia corymbosa var. corymbosa TaxID=529605 RepID=A0AAV1DUS8_OLDCO|nr:OLC1v1011934C1 [Oldenlandia corymbosa var. corymbosa]